MDYILEKNNYWTLYKNEEERVLYFESKNDLCFHYNTFHITHNTCGLDSYYGWNDGHSNGISIIYHSQRILYMKGVNKGNSRVIAIVTEYDFDLNIISKYITVYGDKVCDYYLTKGQFEYIIDGDFVSVIYQTFKNNKYSLDLYIYNDDTDYATSLLKWDNVKSWKRLTFEYNNKLYKSPFVLIETDRESSLFNIFTLGQIDVTGIKYIHPIVRAFNYRDVTLKHSEEFVINSNIFVLLDKSLYDEGLNFVLSLPLSGCINIIDVFYNFIAVSDKDKDLHVYVFNFDKKSLYEVHTHYVTGINKEPDKLIFESSSKYIDGIYFDCIDHKFKVDLDVVNKKLKQINEELRKNRVYETYDDYDDYGLMDALDGDPDAYWNID